MPQIQLRILDLVLDNDNPRITHAEGSEPIVGSLADIFITPLEADSAMIEDNISEFNAQVTRAIATLYKAHPTKINLGVEHILAPPAAKTDTDFETRMEFASGTLTWLVRNGLVTGDLNEDGNFSLIFGAQHRRALTKLS